MLNNEGETAYQNCEMSLKQYFREKIIDTHICTNTYIWKEESLNSNEYIYYKKLEKNYSVSSRRDKGKNI